MSRYTSPYLTSLSPSPTLCHICNKSNQICSVIFLIFEDTDLSMQSPTFTLQLRTLARRNYSLQWDWFSVDRGVGVRFLTREICLARDSAEECEHVGECFPWEWFGEDKKKKNVVNQKVDEEKKLSEEVSKYFGSEGSEQAIDQPILHPAVHSTRKPGQVMYRPTLLRYV